MTSAYPPRSWGRRSSPPSTKPCKKARQMEDKPQPTSLDQKNIFVKLTDFIVRVCPRPPKTGIRIPSSHLKNVMRLSREQLGGLVLVLVIASFVLVLTLHPRLIIPDYEVTGTLTGPVTIWTGNIKIESNVIVDGTNTLIIDGAIIHRDTSYAITVRDSGNLTIINGADALRVICEDNSVVRISNSTVEYMSVNNKGGDVTIEADSYVVHLGAYSDGALKIVDSTIRKLYTGTKPAMKPKLLNSTIKTLHVPVYVSGNFSIIGDVWSGEYDVMIDVDDDSVIEWQRYFLYVSDSVEGFIESPTAKLDSIIVHDSKLSLKSVNYSSIPLSYLEKDTYAPGGHSRRL